MYNWLLCSLLESPEREYSLPSGRTLRARCNRRRAGVAHRAAPASRTGKLGGAQQLDAQAHGELRTPTKPSRMQPQAQPPSEQSSQENSSPAPAPAPAPAPGTTLSEHENGNCSLHYTNCLPPLPSAAAPAACDSLDAYLLCGTDNCLKRFRNAHALQFHLSAAHRSVGAATLADAHSPPQPPRVQNAVRIECVHLHNARAENDVSKTARTPPLVIRLTQAQLNGSAAAAATGARVAPQPKRRRLSAASAQSRDTDSSQPIDVVGLCPTQNSVPLDGEPVPMPLPSQQLPCAPLPSPCHIPISMPMPMPIRDPRTQLLANPVLSPPSLASIKLEPSLYEAAAEAQTERVAKASAPKPRRPTSPAYSDISDNEASASTSLVRPLPLAVAAAPALGAGAQCNTIGASPQPQPQPVPANGGFTVSALNGQQAPLLLPMNVGAPVYALLVASPSQPTFPTQMLSVQPNSPIAAAGANLNSNAALFGLSYQQQHLQAQQQSPIALLCSALAQRQQPGLCSQANTNAHAQSTAAMLQHSPICSRAPLVTQAPGLYHSQSLPPPVAGVWSGAWSGTQAHQMAAQHVLCSQASAAGSSAMLQQFSPAPSVAASATATATATGTERTPSGARSVWNSWPPFGSPGSTQHGSPSTRPRAAAVVQPMQKQQLLQSSTSQEQLTLQLRQAPAFGAIANGRANESVAASICANTSASSLEHSKPPTQSSDCELGD